MIGRIQILFFLLISVLLFSGCTHKVRTYKQAKNGFLDLSQWNFNKQGLVLLSGDWSFYWNQLLTPADFNSKHLISSNYRVPGIWNNLNVNDHLLTGNGFATFRLKLKIKKEHELLELFLPTQATAYLLYVNGKEISRNGFVGTSKETSIPEYKPTTVVIYSDTSELDFVLQVSNYHHFEGGMWHSIWLGSQHDIDTYFQSSLIMDIFLIGSIFIMALYHLGLYLYRRKMLSALYFSIFCFMISTRVFITPNHYENYLFAQNWSVITFIEIFTFIAAAPFFFLYTYTLFGSLIKKRYLYLVFFVFVLQTLLILVTSPQFYFQTIPYFKSAFIIEIIYIIYILGYSLIKKLEGSVTFLVGTLCLVAASLNDLLVGSTYSFSDFSIQYGLFLFIFSQAYLLSKLFSNSFSKNELLSSELTFINANLENLVIKRTKEVELAYKKLKEMDKFKEGLTGMIVHDLKNPLNTILGNAENKEVIQAGNQMLNMVLNILDVQKFENTQMKLQLLIYPLYKIAKHALTQVSMLIDRKSIDCVNLIPIELLVLADFEIANRIFINLLTNAIKFTPNNGRIELNAIENPTASMKRLNIKITVSDTGEGIPEDHLQTIFDKFVQVKAKDSGGVRSSGLGLSFCKLAVEAHGGAIGVNSILGNGSQFWFTLQSVKSSKNKDNQVVESIEQEQSIPNNLLLTKSDCQFLSIFAAELTKYSVYEYSHIKKILDTIECADNKEVQHWVNSVYNTLKSCNEEKYSELINL